MTFFVSDYPRESFFNKDRIVLGMLPLAGACLAFGTAAWCFKRGVLFANNSLAQVTGFCVVVAIGAMLLVLVAGGVYQSLHGF